MLKQLKSMTNLIWELLLK